MAKAACQKQVGHVTGVLSKAQSLEVMDRIHFAVGIGGIYQPVSTGSSYILHTGAKILWMSVHGAMVRRYSLRVFSAPRSQKAPDVTEATSA